MNTVKKFRVLCITGILLLSLHSMATPQSIIPKPVSLEYDNGVFILNSGTKIFYSDQKAKDVAFWLAEMLKTQSKYPQLTERNGKGINLIINKLPDKTLGDEGYFLDISQSSVNLFANKTAGIFYGIQTLLKLLPKEIESPTCKQMTWSVPCVKIKDYPRFGWRGLMLDVSRHFFSKEFMKKYIDQMAKYKFNVLHWHLTDDQGWRIEIKSFPELTEKGAWRVPRLASFNNRPDPYGGEKTTYGGYYTQEDIREIVKYAGDRFVTIVPEIDVPGHSMAAIACYPQLSCTGGHFDVPVSSKFYKFEDNALCAGSEFTYEFMGKVLSEVADLFPGKYVHIGGDECYKGFWAKCEKCQNRMKEKSLGSLDELQSYFIGRMDQVLKSKGKKMIGWDEILEGGLAPDAAVMSWRGIEGGIAAAKMGHPAVMTPALNCYLDYYQGDHAVEPLAFGRLIRLKDCYDFDPVPEDTDSTWILGAQGNVWTEFMPTERQVEYMTWPRAMAQAEVLWSPRNDRSWNDFVRRVEINMQRLNEAEINFATSMYDAIIYSKKGESWAPYYIVIDTEVEGLDVYYALDGTYPDKYSTKYTQPFEIPIGGDMLRVITYKNGKPKGKMIQVNIGEIRNRLKP